MNRKPINIIFFGDSICVGQNISLHKGWVTKISSQFEKLGEKYDRDIIVTNTSANGRTTREALINMPYEIQSNNPDILIIQFGMNDCNYWDSDRVLPRVSPKSFAANLEEIVIRGLTFGAKYIFLNSNHPTGLINKCMTAKNISFQKSNEDYNKIIRQVAVSLRSKVIFNDLEKGFFEYIDNQNEKLDELIFPFPDLLHLSEKGHEMYFKLIYPKLEKCILSIIKSEDNNE